MDVPRETPDITTKPHWYDLANILACASLRAAGSALQPRGGVLRLRREFAQNPPDASGGFSN